MKKQKSEHGIFCNVLLHNDAVKCFIVSFAIVIQDSQVSSLLDGKNDKRKCMLQFLQPLGGALFVFP